MRESFRRLSGSFLFYAVLLILIDSGIGAMASLANILIACQLLAFGAAHVAGLYLQAAAHAYLDKRIACADYHVFVKMPCGRTATFLGGQQSTVADLRSFVGAACNASADLSIQSLSGGILSDPAKLLPECVPSGGTINVLPRLRGGGPKRKQDDMGKAKRLAENITGGKTQATGRAFCTAGGGAN